MSKKKISLDKKTFNSEEINELWNQRKKDSKSEIIMLNDLNFKIRKTNNIKKPIDQISSKTKKSKLESKEELEKEERTSRIKIVTITLLIIIGIVALILFLWLINHEQIVYAMVSLLVSVFTIGGSFIIYMYKRNYMEETKVKSWWRLLNDEEKRSVLLTALASIIIITLFILGIYVPIFEPLAVAWSITAIAEIRIIAFIVDRVQSSKKEENKEEYKKFNRNNFIGQSIVFALLIPIVVHLLLGTNFGLDRILFKANISNAIFSFACILISISGILGVLNLKRIELDNKGNIVAIDYDFDKASMIRFFASIFLPILSIFLFPIYSDAVIGYLNVEAQISGGDWFNRIYYEILSSPYTQFVLVMVLISSLVVLIGKARGPQGGPYLVIGALGIGGIPAMITIFIFAGAVPAPQVFYELFSAGFAELVFAIAFVAMIGLILSIVGIFYEIVPSTGSFNLDNEEE